jgi:hypothetical protein
MVQQLNLLCELLINVQMAAEVVISFFLFFFFFFIFLFYVFILLFYDMAADFFFFLNYSFMAKASVVNGDFWSMTWVGRNSKKI